MCKCLTCFLSILQKHVNLGRKNTYLSAKRNLFSPKSDLFLRDFIYNSCEVVCKRDLGPRIYSSG